MTDVKKEQEQSTNYVGTDKAVQTDEISDENDTSSDKQSLKKLTRSLTEMSIECGTVPARTENKENPITIDDIGDMTIDKKGIVQDKVRTVFELPETEVLVNEFPCYLIRLVTIPGWMYVTNNYICFYASLPGKKKGPYKAGYLTKKNHITSPRTYRYYFELRNHILSWYSSAETKYSPLNSIDLKHIVKIEPSRLKKYGIRLSTSNSHHYTLIADTELSQKEWMDELRKGVFVAQHSGNSVRIVLPFIKIAVVEKPSVFQFANNIKIKFVDDNADGEDYYFAFFPDIELAYNEIINLWKSHVSTTDLKKLRPQSMPAVNKINYTSINFPSFDSFLENISPAALPTLLMGKLLNITGLSQNGNTNHHNKTSNPEDEEEDEEEDVFSDGNDYDIQDPNPQQKSGLFSSLKKHNHNKKDPQKRLSRTSIFFHWPTPEPIEEASTSSPSSSDGVSSSPEESTNDDKSSMKPPVSLNSLTRIPRAVSDAFKHQASTATTPTTQQPPPLQQLDDKRRRSSSLSMLKNTFYRNNRKDTSELDIADTAIHSNHSGDVSLTSTPEMTKNRSSSIGGMLLSGGSKTWHKLTPSNDFNLNQHENHRHPKGPMWMNTKMMKDLQYLQDSNKPTDTALLEEEGYVTDEEDTTDQMSTLSQEQRTMNEHLNTNFPMLLKTEHVEAAFKASFWRTIPYPGKIYVTDKYFCFHSKILAGKQKLIVPWLDVIQVNKLKSKSYYLVHGMTLIVKHMTDPLYFDFSSIEIRDHCFDVCQLKYENKMITDTSSVYSKESKPGALSMSSIILDRSEHIEPPRDFDGPPLLSTSSSASTSIINKSNRPDRSLHFTCLTIGSRGDVQPYVALCKELQKDGHRCRIATHPEYEDWVTGHGIEFRSIGGDPGELMKLCIDNSFLSVSFIREGTKFFYSWFESLLQSAYEACQGTDVIIESPSAMIGVHMAEKLQVPYFRSMPFPFTRTTKFPHPFAVQATAGGRIYNDMTYVMIDMALWAGTAKYVNRFRRKVLKLPSTTLDGLELWKVPYIYSFSPTVVHPPKDWPDFIHVTGYWFLDNPDQKWKPEDALIKFLEQDNDDRPIVYIGFGSIIVPDAAETTRTIIESVLQSGVKAIICKGWSTRNIKEGSGGKEEVEVDDEDEVLLDLYPGTIYNIDAIPHDWLFPKIQGVVHHGGAGTTAAGLRAGLPTIVKPFFGDQRFWGQRLEELGVGLCLNKLNKQTLTDALITITQNQTMITKAKSIGETIRKENGPRNAVESIYREFEYAKEQRIRHS